MIMYPPQHMSRAVARGARSWQLTRGIRQIGGVMIAPQMLGASLADIESVVFKLAEIAGADAAAAGQLFLGPSP